MWTLILSFTIGIYSNGNPAITSNSISIPNIRSKVLCEAVGKEHIEKYKNNKYQLYVGIYSCIEQTK